MVLMGHKRHKWNIFIILSIYFNGICGLDLFASTQTLVEMGPSFLAQLIYLTPITEDRLDRLHMLLGQTSFDMQSIYEAHGPMPPSWTDAVRPFLSKREYHLTLFSTGRLVRDENLAKALFLVIQPHEYYGVIRRTFKYFFPPSFPIIVSLKIMDSLQGRPSDVHSWAPFFSLYEDHWQRLNVLTGNVHGVQVTVENSLIREVSVPPGFLTFAIEFLRSHPENASLSSLIQVSNATIVALYLGSCWELSEEVFIESVKNFYSLLRPEHVTSSILIQAYDAIPNTLLKTLMDMPEFKGSPWFREELLPVSFMALQSRIEYLRSENTEPVIGSIPRSQCEQFPHCLRSLLSSYRTQIPICARFNDGRKVMSAFRENIHDILDAITADNRSRWVQKVDIGKFQDLLKSFKWLVVFGDLDIIPARLFPCTISFGLKDWFVRAGARKNKAADMARIMSEFFANRQSSSISWSEYFFLMNHSGVDI